MSQPASTTPRRRPDLFIVGAPKAGTTSLYEYLIGHPDVFMSPVKEPAYFSPDVPRRMQPYVYGRDEERYLELFAGAGTARRVGEASTYYLFSRRAPELIRDFQPDARIVVMLRNPIDLMHSMHGQRVSMGEEKIESFERALAADEERGHGSSSRSEVAARGGTYRRRAMLGEQLELWLATFPRDRVHVIVLDDFRDDTEGEFRRLLEFLEVDPSYRPASFAVHNRRHRQRRGLARAMLHNRLTHWLANDLLPRVIGSDRTARLARRLRQSPVAVRRVTPEAVDPALREQLERELRPDVEKLSRLLGRDLVALWFGADDRSGEASAAHEPASLRTESSG